MLIERVIYIYINQAPIKITNSEVAEIVPLRFISRLIKIEIGPLRFKLYIIYQKSD